MAIITLTTDFGTREWFVAAMKGVMAGIAPETRVVDVTHEIEGHNVLAGAFVLAQCCRNFPAGTIHVAVVDPGVGSPRRAVAVKTADHIFLAPDNGVLTLALAGLPTPEIRTIENRKLFNPPVSRTFHGRDIFAPVAAHLATGLPWTEIGPAAERIVLLETAEPQEIKGGLEGRVLHADRFGNLITNIDARHLEQRIGGEPKRFRIGRHVIRKFGRFYAEVAPGEAIALIGSS